MTLHCVCGCVAVCFLAGSLLCHVLPQELSWPPQGFDGLLCESYDSKSDSFNTSIWVCVSVRAGLASGTCMPHQQQQQPRRARRQTAASGCSGWTRLTSSRSVQPRERGSQHLQVRHRGWQQQGSWPWSWCWDSYCLQHSNHSNDTAAAVNAAAAVQVRDGLHPLPNVAH